MDKIIKLIPNRVWRTYKGGKRLDQFHNLPNPTDSSFPEDWIASLTKAVNPGREALKYEGLSKIDYNGKEVLLSSLIEENPLAILGKAHYDKYGSSFAFLLKFLDSAIRLHLQCHPTVQFANQYLNSKHGKTEGYYILDTRPEVENPYILMGFQHPPSLEKLKAAIEQQDINFLENCFEKIPVKRGDAFYVPGGLPHAIGEGVLMVEIMEPTDLVVRIEFEKAGYILPEKARFMGRGIDFALSMFEMDEISSAQIRDKYFIKPKLVFGNESAQEYVIFDQWITPCFRLNKLEVYTTHLLSQTGFYLLIIISGRGTIQSENERYDVSVGEKFLIPNDTDQVLIHANGKMEMLIALPPL